MGLHLPSKEEETAVFTRKEPANFKPRQVTLGQENTRDMFMIFIKTHIVVQQEFISKCEIKALL